MEWSCGNCFQTPESSLKKASEIVSTVNSTNLSKPRLIILWNSTYRCSNGACITKNLKCDYTDDCGDASDESQSSCSGYLGRCNFQKDICGWKQLADDEMDWKRQQGPTSSGGTGPARDHTLGTQEGNVERE